MIVKVALTRLLDLSLSTVTMLSGTDTSPFVAYLFHFSFVIDTPSDSHVTFASCPCRTMIGVVGIKTK